MSTLAELEARVDALERATYTAEQLANLEADRAVVAAEAAQAEADLWQSVIGRRVTIVDGKPVWDAK